MTELPNQSINQLSLSRTESNIEKDSNNKRRNEIFDKPKRRNRCIRPYPMPGGNQVCKVLASDVCSDKKTNMVDTCVRQNRVHQFYGMHHNGAHIAALQSVQELIKKCDSLSQGTGSLDQSPGNLPVASNYSQPKNQIALLRNCLSCINYDSDGEYYLCEIGKHYTTEKLAIRKRDSPCCSTCYNKYLTADEFGQLLESKKGEIINLEKRVVFHDYDRECTDNMILKVRDMIKERTGFFFKVHYKGHSKKGNVSYRFYCAQDKCKEKPSIQSGKRKNARRMERYSCCSFLTVCADALTDIMKIKIRHTPHPPYESVAISDDVINPEDVDSNEKEGINLEAIPCSPVLNSNEQFKIEANLFRSDINRILDIIDEQEAIGGDPRFLHSLRNEGKRLFDAGTEIIKVQQCRKMNKAFEVEKDVTMYLR